MLSQAAVHKSYMTRFKLNTTFQKALDDTPTQINSSIQLEAHFFDLHV